MCYLGNKEQKAVFLVVSQLDMHFGFEHLFFACPIGCTNKIACPKNWVPRKKICPPLIYRVYIVLKLS